jgi:uncharacterized protein RhaS with RHS repeats
MRDYDPAVGRYIESDPIGLLGGSYSTYAYANANPINMVDRSGLAPGDSFASVEAAAIDALNYVGAKPDCNKREYGGAIYKQWSLFGPPQYTYDEPTALGQTAGDIPLPAFHGTYGLFHSHTPTYGYNYNQYSQDDEDAADSLNIPSYLLTPNGQILVYKPIPGQPEEGAVSTVAHAKCGCTQ